MAILVSVLVEEKDRKLPQVDRLIASFLGSDHLGMEAPNTKLRKWKEFQGPGSKKTIPNVLDKWNQIKDRACS